MSLEFKLLLEALPDQNLNVVVFILSFYAPMVERLIKSALFGIGKLNGSGLLKPLEVPAAGVAFDATSLILVLVFYNLYYMN